VLKSKHIISTLLAIVLATSFISPAHGNQLIEEKAKLATLQASFDSINNQYQNAVRSLPKLTEMVSRLDPAKDAPLIEKYNSQIAIFNGLVTTLGPQVEPARAALEAQTIIVNQLDTATNFGKKRSKKDIKNTKSMTY
jgi:L-lactate utilization protein LutB